MLPTTDPPPWLAPLPPLRGKRLPATVSTRCLSCAHALRRGGRRRDRLCACALCALRLTIPPPRGSRAPLLQRYLTPHHQEGGQHDKRVDACEAGTRTRGRKSDFVWPPAAVRAGRRSRRCRRRRAHGLWDRGGLPVVWPRRRRAGRPGGVHPTSIPGGFTGHPAPRGGLLCCRRCGMHPRGRRLVRHVSSCASRPAPRLVLLDAMSLRLFMGVPRGVELRPVLPGHTSRHLRLCAAGCVGRRRRAVPRRGGALRHPLIFHQRSRSHAVDT